MRSNLNLKTKDGKRILDNEVFDWKTQQQLKAISQKHPMKHDKIRGRKRYKKASLEARAGIEQAIKERRMRRLKAFWDPDM